MKATCALVLVPPSIELSGPQFFSEGNAAFGCTFVPIGGLSVGMVLQDVTVRDDGFRASLRGENVGLFP
ncbi:hypothetical protein AB0282_11650 [Pseudarthrobacter oxydans]|jgi:hypothetical protein|uniref:hypothetical protein n=1 Tax=Pseudarthrobacter oxydans TaxID=1671 RepID=UPI000CEC416B|nr:hypothetical protein NCCP2145_31020 [Pseudarthrobacter sp. NCCP-2145]